MVTTWKVLPPSALSNTLMDSKVKPAPKSMFTAYRLPKESKIDCVSQQANPSRLSLAPIRLRVQVAPPSVLRYSSTPPLKADSSLDQATMLFGLVGLIAREHSFWLPDSLLMFTLGPATSDGIVPTCGTIVAEDVVLSPQSIVGVKLAAVASGLASMKVPSRAENDCISIMVGSVELAM